MVNLIAIAAGIGCDYLIKHPNKTFRIISTIIAWSF